MSGTMPLRQAAGQVLVAGLEGPQLSVLEAAWMRLLRPAGVILFRRNLESAPQTHALLSSVSTATSMPMLRCIDVEGGTVDRLRDLIAPMPSPFAVAATNKAALFRKHGALIGREVRMLGFNTTFAPVLDLRTSASEGVMTTRVVAGSATEVTRYARRFLEGLAQQHVLGCGKHFPGLGSGQVDSHHTTPLIEKPLNLLWKEDLLPYRELAAQLPMVMVSHGSYPAAVAEPASISGYWINEVLVRELGYRGLIVSDDMEMGGILTHVGIAEAAVQALLAGTHVIEICRDPALIFAGYEALLREAETSPTFARILRRAAARVAKVHDVFQDTRAPRPPSAVAVQTMRIAVEQFSSEVASAA